MNIGDTYHNHCNDQPSTWTVTHLEGDKVTVYSPQSDRSYTISQVIFEDTMRALGFELQGEKPARYKIWLINFNRYFGPNDEYDSLEAAITIGKMSGFEFRVELGGMICATWGPLSGLRVTTEYQQWVNDQQYMLAQREGSYP